MKSAGVTSDRMSEPIRKAMSAVRMRLDSGYARWLGIVVVNTGVDERVGVVGVLPSVICSRGFSSTETMALRPGSWGNATGPVRDNRESEL